MLFLCICGQWAATEKDLSEKLMMDKVSGDLDVLGGYKSVILAWVNWLRNGM